MIPKIIHYCWFGGKPKPESFYICLDSWKKYLPDYKIIEWNESNFDINCCEYVRLAAEQRELNKGTSNSVSFRDILGSLNMWKLIFIYFAYIKCLKNNMI